MHFQRRQLPPQPFQEDDNRLFKNIPPSIEASRPGYPRLGAFVNSDKNFVAFRRFGNVHVRLLLNKQDKIAELENGLNSLDSLEANDFNLRTRRADNNAARQDLYARLEGLIVEYDALLDSYLRQIERPSIPEGNIRSVTNWMRDNKPIVATESSFLNNWDDLIGPTAPQTRTMIESLLGNCAELLHNYNFSSILTSASDRMKSTNRHVLFVTEARLVNTARFFITLSTVFFLTMPIIMLYYLDSTPARLKAVAIQATLFAVFVCVIGHWRAIEIFSVTATYSAVLVVFVTASPNK